jgi:ACS family tartrate transporter-like MFS transporter
MSDDGFKGEATIRKVTRRLVPFLILCYFAAYLDRVNLSFAAATMNRDLGFSPTVYGWGAGVFFLGYALLEAPSNFMLHRVGARLWIARIMLSWGVVSALSAFIRDAGSFYAVRFLLGVAEAGFMPGVILYLTWWIPEAQRGRILAAFLFAVPLATVAGAPLSEFLLTVADGTAGLQGWQWLFIVEAAPAIVLGLATPFVLTDRPDDATWLTAEERTWLVAAVGAPAPRAGDWRDVRAALCDLRALALGVAYFGVVFGLYGLSMWLPQIIVGYGLGPVAASAATATPFAVGALAMLVWGRLADRSGHYVRFTAIAAVVAALGLFAAAGASTLPGAIAAICVAAAGVFSVLPTFWAMVSALFGGGVRAAIAIALINSIGNLAGFLGPYLVGWIRETTGAYGEALLALAVGALASAGVTLLAGRDSGRAGTRHRRK